MRGQGIKYDNDINIDTKNYGEDDRNIATDMILKDILIFFIFFI